MVLELLTYMFLGAFIMAVIWLIGTVIFVTAKTRKYNSEMREIRQEVDAKQREWLKRLDELTRLDDKVTPPKG